MLFGVLNLSFWGYVAAGIVLTQITIASVTIYLHRHQTHRALTLHPIISHFFRFWLWLTTGMVTAEWVAIHRKHHATTDVDGDPHSPVVLGLKKVFWQGAELYREASRNKDMVKKYGHGTPNDWIERNVYTRHSAKGIFLMLLVDLFLFGVPGVSIWAIQMMWIPVWAAGVTYKKSADGRNEEQSNAIKLNKPRAQLSNPTGLTAYDMIYAQDPENGRPEIFYKAEPGTAAATGEAVTIRPDSELDVPEPELVLVFNSTGKLVGYTMGNDMSSRDIEGQNPLYLPQAKVYYRSTALGPFLYLDDEKTSTPGAKLGDGVKSNWKISMKVFGPDRQVKFEGETRLDAIKNTFENLKDHLQKYQNLKNGAALFTGTGILPPNNFKLEEGDTVKMTINEIGTLENRVVKTPEVIDDQAEKLLSQAQFIQAA